MNENLRRETERLAWSWRRYEEPVLRDYLVAGLEDPRLNLQSILSRHFLIYAASGGRFVNLMEQEYRFSAALNWLASFFDRGADAAESGAVVLHALRLGADNAEGFELPRFLGRVFGELPAETEGQRIPNYIEAALNVPATALQGLPLGLFCTLWKRALSTLTVSRRLTVLEPACGSANDYRALVESGLVGFLDYFGFDLCDKNIANAREMFPGAAFQTGNVFEINFADRSFDLCFVHDLFEHLSPEGIQVAAAEVCRVARTGMCIHFFNMDEIPRHEIRPVEQYFWNLLSMQEMRHLFAEHGFRSEVLHVATFLREHVGCEDFHNPNAYTFRLFRA